MTPQELQNKWNLSNTELALVLGKGEATVKSYKVRPDAKSFRNTPQTVIQLCIQLDKNWSRQGEASIKLLSV